MQGDRGFREGKWRHRVVVEREVEGALIRVLVRRAVDRIRAT